MAAKKRITSKLELSLEMTDHERSAIDALPFRYSRLGPRVEIVRQGDMPSSSCIVVEGFAATSKHTCDGRRAIAAIHVPGDMPDIMSIHLHVMDCTLQTVSPCFLAFLDHNIIRELCEAHPRIASALWRTTLIEASVYREGVVNIGHRSASARLAHLFCELMTRCNANKRLDTLAFELPLTQTDLADMTGLSTVHINRSLMSLRASGAISYDQGTVTIHNWRKLTRLGDFDADYLHLPQHSLLTGTDGNLWSLGPGKRA